jgi:hypothetical protein
MGLTFEFPELGGERHQLTKHQIPANRLSNSVTNHAVENSWNSLSNHKGHLTTPMD